jgi:hypothetical protein
MEIHDKKSLRSEWRTERKRMVKNWGEEKMKWRGCRGRLKASFTDGFPDGYKINYYFNLFRRWGVKNPSVIFEFRTKFFNGAPYFSNSVGKSVGKMTRSKMHLMHNPLIFAQSVGNCVGKNWHITDGYKNYFRTLCEMPTDLRPSVIWWHYQ